MNIAIIPARGGSKGIPGKNIMNFCGKPLIAWTIEQARNSKQVDEVYVSTDDEVIATISARYGANIIWRPAELATDTASSESAVLHALSEIENKAKVDCAMMLQATSPIRATGDIDGAISLFKEQGADSLFSAAILEDYCIWKESDEGLYSVTYDYKNRGRRQERKPHFLENGSLYIFKPHIIKTYQNRLGGKIVIYPMEFWKSYEIDSLDDVSVCSFFMQRITKC